MSYDVIQASRKTEETENVNTEEEMQKTENDNSLTKMKLQKGLGVIRKRKQEAKQFCIIDEAIVNSTSATMSMVSSKTILKRCVE